MTTEANEPHSTPDDAADYCPEGYLDEAEARAADFAAATSALVAILEPRRHHAPSIEAQRLAALWCAERMHVQAGELLSALQDRRSVAKAATATEAENPDAELIRHCDALPALKAAYEDDARDDDENPIAAPYHAACAAISATTPQTMAGIIAKARAAVADGWAHGDRADVFHSDCEAWSWDVVRALAQIAPPLRA